MAVNSGNSFDHMLYTNIFLSKLELNPSYSSFVYLAIDKVLPIPDDY